jgi:dipeptidase E
MVLTPGIGEDFVGWKPPTGDDGTLGVVDFSIFPHVDHPDLPENTMAAGRDGGPAAVGPGVRDRRRHDDQSASADTVEVVSEGHWKLFAPSHEEGAGGRAGSTRVNAADHPTAHADMRPISQNRGRRS